MVKSILKIVDFPIKKYLFKQIKCIILLVVYTGSTLMFPMFMSYIVDQGIVPRNFHKTIFLVLMMAVVGILSVIFQYLQQVSFYELAQVLILGIKKNIYAKLLETNGIFWGKNNVGDILIVLNEDVAALETILTRTVSNIIVNSIVVVGISIFILSIDWKIGVAVLFLAIIFAYVQKKMGGRVESIVEKLRSSIGNLASFTSETLQNMNYIESSGYSEMICDKYTKQNKNVIENLISQMKVVTGTQCIGTLFSVTGILCVLCFGSYLSFRDDISIGILFALTVYVQRLYGPIVSLGSAYVEIRNTVPRVKKILKIIDTPDIITSGSYCPTIQMHGKIEFKKVCFKYDTKKILDEFNIIVNPGRILGIIGPNGVGKSTIFKLLLKLYNVSSGNIFIDDVKIERYNKIYLRKNIAYVCQENYMLSGTLREVLDPENLLRDYELFELMKGFQFDISAFIQGINTKIDENHRNISGGEMQKIALIRAFTKDKMIYLMDEPTSAIDITSEKIICNTLKEKLKGKTAIIITHRPEILNICDDIFEYYLDSSS